MDNDAFKLETKRYLAWGIGGIAVGTLAISALYTVYTGATELATLTLGMLGTTVAGIVGFYFGKKVSEE